MTTPAQRARMLRGDPEARARLQAQYDPVVGLKRTGGLVPEGHDFGGIVEDPGHARRPVVRERWERIAVPIAGPKGDPGPQGGTGAQGPKGDPATKQVFVQPNEPTLAPGEEAVWVQTDQIGNPLNVWSLEA